MARRALTLLELLLALSLLLALWALVLPIAVDSLRQRAFEANTEIIRNQLLLARAHAGASGRPVEIFYDPDPSRIEARYFDADAAGDRSAPRGAQRSAARGSAGAGSSSDGSTGPDPERAGGAPGTPDPIVESWAENLLPAGLSITAQAPGTTSPPGTIATAGALPRPLRLALYMPDGSALLSRPVWIGDGHGRQAQLTINPWTGLPVQEVSPSGEGPGAQAPDKGGQP